MTDTIHQAIQYFSAKEKWYRRKHIGVTEKSNPLFPVYFQHVCDAKFPGGTVIAKCLSRDKEVLKANAKLIASAPKLLDALKEALPYITGYDVEAKARQAIKNAE